MIRKVFIELKFDAVRQKNLRALKRSDRKFTHLDLKWRKWVSLSSVSISQTAKHCILKTDMILTSMRS